MTVKIHPLDPKKVPAEIEHLIKDIILDIAETYQSDLKKSFAAWAQVKEKREQLQQKLESVFSSSEKRNWIAQKILVRSLRKSVEEYQTLSQSAFDEMLSAAQNSNTSFENTRRYVARLSNSTIASPTESEAKEGLELWSKVTAISRDIDPDRHWLPRALSSQIKTIVHWKNMLRRANEDLELVVLDEKKHSDLKGIRFNRQAWSETSQTTPTVDQIKNGQTFALKEEGLTQDQVHRHIEVLNLFRSFQDVEKMLPSQLGNEIRAYLTVPPLPERHSAPLNIEPIAPPKMDQNMISSRLKDRKSQTVPPSDPSPPSARM